jgi:hypothetical protein
MAFYGTIPEAPDIRKQRPGYFNKPIEFPRGFAMPEGVSEFDPGADPWQHAVPDLWPEIEQELKGILQQGRGKFYTAPEGGELTPEQAEHNKMLMAWKSPAGLQAIETGKYREQQARHVEVDRAEKRVANIEKQILQASKVEGVPTGLVQQLEKRYNSAVKQLDTLLTSTEGGVESGYPRYTGKGKFELEGIEKEPGFWSRLFKRTKETGEAIPPVPTGEFETPEEVAAAPADIAPQKSNLMLKGLLEADRLFAKHLGSDEAKRVTDQIVASTKDPGERLEKALAALPAKAKKDPEVRKLSRQMTIWKMTPERKAKQAMGPPPGQTAESMPILRRYQRGIPEPGGK